MGGRKKGNQRPISGVQEASGFEKLKKRKGWTSEDAKQAAELAKHFKPVQLENETAIQSANQSLRNEDNPPSSAAIEVDRCNVITVEDSTENLTMGEQPETAQSSLSPGAIVSPFGEDSLSAQLADTSEVQTLLPHGAFHAVLSNLNNSSEVNYSDPSSWPYPLSQTMKLALTQNAAVQIIRDAYPRTDGRGFHKNHFEHNSKAGIKVKRDWLMYSDSTDSLFCFACCLFSGVDRCSKSPFSNYGSSSIGFRSYDKLSRGISMHEESQQHRSADLAWRDYCKSREQGTSLVAVAENAHRQEVSFWKEVLKAILDAVFFLAKNNLPFRGTCKKIGEPENGIFLSLLELISNYHGPLATHIERLKPGRVSYLLPRIQNEFISLAASSVRSSIIEKIKSRKHFSILLDATPDCSNQEQISQVVRTVRVEASGCEVEENFIDFIHFDRKTGKEISNMTIKKLQQDGLDLVNCRGQGFDNGANMAGIYNGVQANISKENPLAKFVPCVAHSLNLVWQNAASKVLPGKLILGQIQNLFSCFSASPARWSVLKSHAKLTLKSQSNTRWSAKANAVHALFSGYKEILEALEEIIESEHFNAQTLADAACQLNQISTFKFLLGMNLWNEILHRINVTNIAVQGKKMDVAAAAKDINGLLDWLNNFEETGFKACLEKAKIIASEVGMDQNSGFGYRSSRNKTPARYRTDEQNCDPLTSNISNIEKFEKEFFNSLMGKLREEFNGRFQALKSIADDFSFLWGEQLDKLSNEELVSCAKDLILKYSEDLDGVNMIREVTILKSCILRHLPDGTQLANTKAKDVLTLLTNENLTKPFINCHTALPHLTSYRIQQRKSFF